MRHTIRYGAIPSMMALALGLSTAAALASGGPGGGGGGGGGGNGGGGGAPAAPLPPLLGHLGGGQPGVFNLFLYHFNFNKDFTYTLIETDSITGATTASFAGTFVISPGPLGFFHLTLNVNGKAVMQFDVTFGVESVIFQNSSVSLILSKEIP